MTNINVQKNQTTIKREIIQRAEEIVVSLKRFVYCRLYTVKEKHKRPTGNLRYDFIFKNNRLEDKKSYPPN